nr:uncharacterized protein LOC129270062 [Lytechinus pictus]
MASHLKSARLEFKLLPFNEKDMKEFKFRGIEALILCHSMEIRGPLSSIYDKFLKKAKDCLGKKKVAAIVHDYKIPLEAHETYDKNNKSKLKMASLVLSLSRRSDDGEIQMTKGQKDRFTLFFNLAVQALPCHKKISRAFYRFFYRVIRQ